MVNKKHIVNNAVDLLFVNMENIKDIVENAVDLLYVKL
jgi:hypothetical protein